MGTSAAVKGKGVCRGVILTLQNIVIVEEFSSIGIRERKCYTRMQWLESFGGMQVNWRNLTM